MQATLKAASLPLLLTLLLFASRVCNGMEHVKTVLLIFLTLFVFAFFVRHTKLGIAALLALLVIQAQWGILQFIVQQDLGFTIVGESTIGPTIDGVAKFSIGETKLVRAYGPYLHANIFAGAMVVGFVLTLLYTPKTWRTYLVPLFILAILLSFSRAAYIASVLAFALTAIKQTDRKRLLLYVGILAIVATPLIFYRLTDVNDESVSERIRGYSWAQTMITQQPLLHGVGIFNYPNALRTFLDTRNITYNSWEIAPVHSVPLLLMAELGLIPAVLILIAITVSRNVKQLLTLAVLAPLLLFDHYFITDMSAFFLLSITVLSRLPQHTQS